MHEEATVCPLRGSVDHGVSVSGEDALGHAFHVLVREGSGLAVLAPLLGGEFAVDLSDLLDLCRHFLGLAVDVVV